MVRDALQTPRAEAEQRLIEIIQETTQFGNVIIPVFGVEGTRNLHGY